MCEGYFRHLCDEAGRNDIMVSSAGTFSGDGYPVSGNSVSALQRIGIDISAHRSTMLSRKLIEETDLIIALADNHRRQIGSVMPKALKKTFLLMDFSSKNRGNDVPDPVGGPPEIYEDCFSEMKPALDNLFLEIDRVIKPDFRLD